jgi:hypothetical protein
MLREMGGKGLLEMKSTGAGKIRPHRLKIVAVRDGF